MLSLPVVTGLLAVFDIYWLFRARPVPTDSPEQRLEKMDLALSSLRGALLIFFLATLLLANVLVYSLSQASLRKVRLDSVKAEEFVLLGKNDQGPYRATLRSEGNGVRLNLMDQNGKKRVAMAISEEGVPVLGVLAADEKPIGYLGQSDEEGTALVIQDRNGKTAVTLNIAPDGAVTLASNVEGKLRMALTYAKGMPILSLHDPSGKGGAVLSVNAAAKKTCLDFFDEKGIKRLELGLKDNVPVINSFDEEGKPLPVKP